MTRVLLPLFSLFLAAPSLAGPAPRWVTVNPVATELALAFGAAHQLVGVDQTSVLPPASSALPRVGYQRMLSAEGILSLHPSLVLATEDAGPPAAIQALREAGVAVEVLPAQPSVAAARERISRVGRLLGQTAKARQMIRSLDLSIALAAKRTVRAGKPTRVLFLYTRGNASALASGADTPADAMLHLAGADNAVQGFTGYRALGPEALVAAAPEVILVPESAAKSLGGIEGIVGLPGIALTPAGRSRRVVIMDDARLLQFGPRLGDTVNELIDRLAPPVTAR